MKQPRSKRVIGMLLAMAGLALIGSIPARAATCSAVGASVSLSPMTITIQRDLPIGPTGNSSTIQVAVRYSCNADDTPVSQHQFGINGDFNSRNGTNYNNRTQFRLGTSGIGYTLLGLSGQSSFCSGSAYLGIGTPIAAVTNSVRLCNSTSGLLDQQSLQGGVQVDFFKLGPVAPGIIPSTLLGAFVSQINADSWPAGVDIYSGAITVVVKACSVTATAITVPMGEEPRGAFTGVGSTADSHDFTIPLDCDASTNINLQLDGLTAGGLPTVLALTASASPPAATGVGVQVLYAGNPVTIGTPIPVGTTPTDGPYNIALQARYYQTSSPVTAGTANSTATFTITYN